MSQTIDDVNCPNCGAPTEIPLTGNTVECEYCGTRVFLPQSLLRQQAPAPGVPNAGWDEQHKKRVLRWVWIIVGIVLAVTIIPPLCTIVFTFCISIFTVLASIPR